MNQKPQSKEVFETKLVKSLRAQFDKSYLHLDFFSLVWLFTLGSLIGFVIEDVFHFIVYQNWESRAGLVWGPFSSIYGVGAIVLTVFLNRFYYTHNLIIFLVSMALGSAIEYGASWMMETFWHAIAWDYTGTFGSIDGRTNFIFGVMWGVLGLSWVRIGLPVIKYAMNHIDFTTIAYRVISMLLALFMIVNCFVTVLALNREGERAHNIPPKTQIDVWLDEYFPDEWLKERFQNMTVSNNLESEKGQKSPSNPPLL